MKENKFEWTDDDVLDFVRYTTTQRPTFQGRYKDLEDFKASKEVKKPLFTTHDGITLYDRNHEVAAIRKGEFKIISQYYGKSISTWLNGWYTTQWLPNPPKEDDTQVRELIKEHYLLFSTEEAAKNYIKWNAPKLSVAEVMSISEFAPNFKGQSIYQFDQQKLLKMVERKINV